MSLNINVLVTAREEYINQLMNILIPYYKVNFKKIFENSQVNSFIKYKLRPFQQDLRYIQKWNEVTVDSRVKELTNQYPYFGELLKAIFVINVKILSCVKTNPKGKGIKIEIPHIPIFVHKLFIEIAKKIYYKPNIILEPDENLEYLIETSIHDMLRNQIPIQQILQEYLMDTFDDSDDSDNEDKSDDTSDSKQEEPHVDELKEIGRSEQETLDYREVIEPQQPIEQPQPIQQQDQQPIEQPQQDRQDQIPQQEEQQEQYVNNIDNRYDREEDINRNHIPLSSPISNKRPVLFEDAKHFN